MKLDLDELLANLPKNEDELQTVQAKHRQILSDNRKMKNSGKPETIGSANMGPSWRHTFRRPLRWTAHSLPHSCRSWPLDGKQNGDVPGETRSVPSSFR